MLRPLLTETSRCFWAWSTPPQPPRMRTQRASLRDDVPGGDGTVGACFPGRGLCCPDDPLDLVLQLFPVDRAPPPPSSLAALGIGGGAGGEPPARLVIEEPESLPQPAESAFGVGGVGGGGLQGSWGLSSFLLEGLWTGLEEVDMFFADDDALDGGSNGGGEATEGNLLPDPTTGVKPEQPAHMTDGGGGGPVHVHTRGSLGGVVVPNDAPPFPSLMPAGAFPLQPYDAYRAFDGAVFSNASTPAPAMTAPMPAGGPPPVFVANNSTPQLPALIMPAAASAPVPLPAAASLHACGALPGIVSNMAAAPPPPLMALMPARALHPNATALAGVYSSCTNAPAAHAPPAATPSSSPPSRTTFGSCRSPSSATSSETEFLQPHHVWVVPRKLRSPPSVNRRKRPWLLDFPLHVLPPVALPQANPTGDDDDDDKGNDDAKNRNAMVLVALAPPGNTTGGDDIAADSGGAGIRRRRAAPRQRNRQAQRVCSHCHSPETPQWRAGPDGPGTLCNACGIRYAANRLLPEYRPSTAPSFRSGQHSNRHRKVMKLREQMKAATGEKPSASEQQPMMEDDGTKEEDDGFMGVYM